MKSKITKTVGVTLTIPLILWIGVFTTDYQRSNSLEKPVFAMSGETLDDGSSVEYSESGYTEVVEYRGIGYTVEVKEYIGIKGVEIESVEMRVGDKLVVASVQ